MPDYVQTVLNFIDTNWNTTNYSTKPILIDQRDGARVNSSERGVSADLATNNAVTVGDSPLDTFEPEGLGWNKERVEAGVNVRVEGIHESEWGHITNAADFESLADEVVRTLRVERVRPLPGYYRLEVRQAANRSGESGDHFRDDYEAYFVGLEDLP